MSTWQLIVGLVAFVLLAACAGGSSPTPAATEQPDDLLLITTGEFEGVILHQGDWLPTVEDVLALEQQLITYLPQQHRAFDSLQAPIEERLPTYKRQYWGVVENGRRLISANFFCESSRYDWMEREVIVIDGGDCYFRLWYDVETGAFSNLMVNGSA